MEDYKVTEILNWFDVELEGVIKSMKSKENDEYSRGYYNALMEARDRFRGSKEFYDRYGND